MPKTHPKPAITVTASRKEFASRAATVRRVLASSLSALKQENAALESYLVTNEEMRMLNAAFRGKNCPTNVLSFEAKGFPRADAGTRAYLGEIYLAPKVIKDKKEDIRLLAVHGLLHLLGYTHETERDRMRMERAEDRLLARAKRS